jgi:hypothetical protein
MFGPLTFSFAVVLVASLCMVIAQPLDSIQYNALMDVYNGLGSFLKPQSCVISDLLFFFWIFFFAFFFSQDATQSHVLDSLRLRIVLYQQHVVVAMS